MCQTCARWLDSRAIRKQIAEELLRLLKGHRECPDDDVAWKLAATFTAEFEACAKDGTLRPELFNLIFSIFAMIKLDTQEVEGINSLAKRCIDMAPAISPALLSARMVCKKNMQVNFSSGELREKLVQSCVKAHKEIKATFDKKGRGAEPAVVDSDVEAGRQCCMLLVGSRKSKSLSLSIRLRRLGITAEA